MCHWLRWMSRGGHPASSANSLADVDTRRYSRQRFEYGSDTPAGGFGNALLTRLPILAIQQWHLTWPTTTYDGTEPSEPRSLLLAKLGHDFEPFWIGSTHLPRGDARARTNALDRLTSLVRRLDAPWIVCGDFNVPASSWLTEAGEMKFCPNPEEPTYPAEHPIEAIDYCIASPGIATDAKVLPTHGSDHCPVLFSARINTTN